MIDIFSKNINIKKKILFNRLKKKLIIFKIKYIIKNKLFLFIFYKISKNIFKTKFRILVEI